MSRSDREFDREKAGKLVMDNAAVIQGFETTSERHDARAADLLLEYLQSGCEHAREEAGRLVQERAGYFRRLLDTSRQLVHGSEVGDMTVIEDAVEGMKYIAVWQFEANKTGALTGEVGKTPEPRSLNLIDPHRGPYRDPRYSTFYRDLQRAGGLVEEPERDGKEVGDDEHF